MSRFAPPNSFIDVGDFSSLETLGEYLSILAKNDVLFASYFWWRDYYTIDVS